mmetsp:Transcript_124423/g.363353  ORF Transcript_124423/g.363353 Transcript_124423/m.363353 type:complete len:248 (+) Transcript_124423:172-915(+)
MRLAVEDGVGDDVEDVKEGQGDRKTDESRQDGQVRRVLHILLTIWVREGVYLRGELPCDEGTRARNAPKASELQKRGRAMHGGCRGALGLQDVHCMNCTFAEGVRVHSNVHVRILVQILEIPLVAVHTAAADFCYACSERVVFLICCVRHSSDDNPQATGELDDKGPVQECPEVVLHRHTPPLDDAPSSSAPVATPLPVLKPPQLHRVCHNKLRDSSAELHNPDHHEKVVDDEHLEWQTELKKCLLG